MTFVADTSALVHAWRRGSGDLALRHIIARDDVAICGPVKLELLRGARNPREADDLLRLLNHAPQRPVSPRAWTIATGTLLDLVGLRGGRHRGVAVSDLLVAAVALESDLTVLHRDRDFDLIASVTGQPMRWFGARPA